VSTLQQSAWADISPTAVNITTLWKDIALKPRSALHHCINYCFDFKNEREINAHQEGGSLNNAGLITNYDSILKLGMCLVNPYTTGINELERFGSKKQLILSKW